MTHHQTERSTANVARDEAADVARAAADRSGDVAGTVSEQAGRVASETTRQARDLLHEGKEQLSGQARQGQQRAADGLRRLADQLHQMAEKADGEGMTPELARQAADRTRGLASWLENRDPDAVLDEVRRFARRKPAAFLIGAAVAGVAVGRLTRGAIAAQQGDSAGAGATRTGPPRPSAPVTPATSTYVAPEAYPSAGYAAPAAPPAATPQVPPQPPAGARRRGQVHP